MSDAAAAYFFLMRKSSAFLPLAISAANSRCCASVSVGSGNCAWTTGTAVAIVGAGPAGIYAGNILTRAVTDAGGTVAIERPPDGGVTFRIELPA